MFFLSLRGLLAEGDMFAKPKCRFCATPWLPPMGVTAAKAFCPKCRDERRQKAKQTLGLKKISSKDFDGKYLLPRSMRNTSRLKRST
jgi:hypothetical protein